MSFDVEAKRYSYTTYEVLPTSGYFWQWKTTYAARSTSVDAELPFIYAISKLRSRTHEEYIKYSERS
jgi:hypothetical protein